jgi:hypothetical protein
VLGTGGLMSLMPAGNCCFPHSSTPTSTSTKVLIRDRLAEHDGTLRGAIAAILLYQVLLSGHRLEATVPTAEVAGT